jgi:predicted enzyme related to lactoylglutathione lyase
MLGDDGNAAAGVCHARGVNLDVPPVWMLYLPVGDLAESLRRVPQEGGKIIKETPANVRAYAYAVLQDPVGAYVALVPG